ncbi:hypothetical protein NEUTE1DRAFT_81221 [Neurospora tetrasperma FGSC 2508]|uniref:Uncharacterized protein n=1 Tax=Neurospora tetrasperma (strain FGSC 2508 / ATCC MYA-4615 / P0657) TaxID=510951 RepID=F8ML81_NEUT8|nr:uncharacterized protein NEUTE1DRAFT_81221 [Neurospora tetrasperma FGSC 2508]EGO57556.1 hypothetical protein NEUTE1DRAFT_81221 [Neurospora tetrasperma FGSC 2508]EGZ72184.1 hypothetical protein NEUTE2DRAFT_111564 [Neurospora tetrasperma FGSC 2509]
MEPRTGPQPLSHRRPGQRVIKSNSVSAALHDYLHNNPGGFDMRFYARRYGVSVGSLTMRLWREKRKKKKEDDATEALDSDEETMEVSRIEAPAALARPTTTTRPERHSLTFPIPKPGKKASREAVEAAFDEYLHSSPPVSGLDIAKKYGLHPSTMNKRIASTKISKDVARSAGDSGKKTRSGRANNLRSNPPSSRRQQEAGVKPGIPGKSIPPPPPPLRPPPTAAVPTPAPTSASGPKQARSLSTLRARVDRINSAMEYIIQNPGHCYKHVAKRFGVGRRTLFGRAAKLRAAGINVPSSTIPGRMPAKRDTYITTGSSSSSSSSRHGDVQPSGGSAEEAIAAVIKVRSSTSQRPRQDQGQGESQKQDPTEKKKKKKKEKESASPPRPQPQSHQERDRGRGLGLRSSSRIKAAAQTSVNAGVSSSSNSNSTSNRNSSTSNSSTSNGSRSKEKSNNNNNNPSDYMSRAERCDAAWEEYLCSNPRPSLFYFARKYGIHKSTLSARKGALKKQGVDVDLLLPNSAKANTNGNAFANGAGSGRMSKVVDLMSDSDLDSDLEESESESESGSEAEDGGDHEIIDAESNVTSPPSSKLVLARRQSMQLSDIQERYLVNWYLREESLGRGAPSRGKLTSMALSLLFDGQEVDLDLQDEEWLGILIQQFLERNPDIKLMVGRAEGGDGIWGEEVMVGLVLAQKMRKPKDGVRMLWGPTAAEAAAAAAAMGYISDENDDEGDWEDEEESDSEQSESDESVSDSEDSEDSEEDDSDSDSDPDSDSDTSTSTSNDNPYNQAFVESLFVKLESTPSPPLLSPAATKGGHKHNNLPTPQSSYDIQQHYLSALYNSQSATQTAQIVKTLCIKTGKALDLKNSALEALREKADRLEKEAGELKKAILEITAAAAAAAAGKHDGLLLDPSPDPGSSPSPLGLSFSEERHEQEKQQLQQEGQEGKRSSSSGSINMSSVSDVDVEREILERATTTTTTDKGLRASPSSIIPPPELEEANSMQESLLGGSNEAGGQGNGESESNCESGYDNEHKGSDTKRPSFLTDDTSTIVSHDNKSRKRRRMVDIEIVLEAKKMFGFAAHDESIGPWTGAYTIGPGAPGKKRRRITERNS